MIKRYTLRTSVLLQAPARHPSDWLRHSKFAPGNFVRVVGFLARLSHVCPIHSSSSTRRRLAENPNCSSLFVLTLETCFRLVYYRYFLENFSGNWSTIPSAKVSAKFSICARTLS